MEAGELPSVHRLVPTQSLGYRTGLDWHLCVAHKHLYSTVLLWYCPVHPGYSDWEAIERDTGMMRQQARVLRGPL